MAGAPRPDARTCATGSPDVESALAEGSIAAGHVDAIAAATARLTDDEKAKFDEKRRRCSTKRRRSRWTTSRRTCNNLARPDAPGSAADAATNRAQLRSRHGVLCKAQRHEPPSEPGTSGCGSQERGVRTQRRTQPAPRSRAQQPIIQRRRGHPAQHGPAEHDSPPRDLRAHRRGILPIVSGGHGEVLDQGRKHRLATPAQRVALRSMYATCVMPGCTVPFDRTEIHHVDEWTGQVGDTDLNRLVPVCAHDHHRIHEGHWTLTLDTDPARTITVTRPDGTIEHPGPSINRPTTTTRAA